MKKILRFATLLLSLLLLCSCTTSLDYKEGKYVNPKTNVSYVAAPTPYQAIAYSPEKVAKVKQKGLDDVLLYAIEGMDGEKWLCSADYAVFYADTEKLPTLWEMNIAKVYVNQTINLSYTVASFTDAEVISALQSIYREGASFPASELEEGLKFDTYDLVFESETLRYCLTYRQYEQEILIYEAIDDPTNFTPRYAGVEVTTEDYRYVKDGVEMVEHLAVYHFGHALMYNRESGICYPVGELVSDYLG